jgi:hypothetical protein
MRFCIFSNEEHDMSTRAIYTFKGFGEAHHVYKHHDGYPTGAAEALGKALALAWPLPRYEPDEFAAAFVAANKIDGGGVRLAKSRTMSADVAFGYTITPDKRLPSLLQLTITAPNFWDGGRSEETLWKGPLVQFLADPEAIEAGFE